MLRAQHHTKAARSGGGPTAPRPAGGAARAQSAQAGSAHNSSGGGEGGPLSARARFGEAHKRKRRKDARVHRAIGSALKKKAEQAEVPWSGSRAVGQPRRTFARAAFDFAKRTIERWLQQPFAPVRCVRRAAPPRWRSRRLHPFRSACRERMAAGTRSFALLPPSAPLPFAAQFRCTAELRSALLASPGEATITFRQGEAVVCVAGRDFDCKSYAENAGGCSVYALAGDAELVQAGEVQRRVLIAMRLV